MTIFERREREREREVEEDSESSPDFLEYRSFDPRTNLELQHPVLSVSANLKSCISMVIEER